MVDFYTIIYVRTYRVASCESLVMNDEGELKIQSENPVSFIVARLKSQNKQTTNLQLSSVFCEIC